MTQEVPQAVLSVLYAAAAGTTTNPNGCSANFGATALRGSAAASAAFASLLEDMAFGDWLLVFGRKKCLPEDV